MPTSDRGARAWAAGEGRTHVRGGARARRLRHPAYAEGQRERRVGGEGRRDAVWRREAEEACARRAAGWPLCTSLRAQRGLGRGGRLPCPMPSTAAARGHAPSPSPAAPLLTTEHASTTPNGSNSCFSAASSVPGGSSEHTSIRAAPPS